MNVIHLTEVENTCGACPTIYEGKTIDGKDFFARLRWGFMYAEVDGITLFETDTPDMDGVCNFNDIQRYAMQNGVFLYAENSVW